MIIRTRGGGELAIENRTFSLSDMTRWGYSGLRGGGTEVTPATVAGIPALHRAVEIRSEAVASLRLRCWKGDAPMREPITTTWQAKLYSGPANPMQTRFAFWETVEESLAWRRNAYVWKNVADKRVVEWWALHPDQVRPQPDGTYIVACGPGFVDPVGRGKAKYQKGPETILHIRGFGAGGSLIAPSPLEVFKEALGITIARQRRETRMWTKGANIQLAVEFPESKTVEQAREYRDLWNESYDGAEGEQTAIMGGGATIKPIGMTMEQAQWAESAKLSVQDAARIMGMPPTLLGVIIDKNIPLERDLDEWLRFGLGPELERIESALVADDDLRGSPDDPYPGFDTNGFVRGDLATNANVEHQQIQDGTLLPDEARATRGRGPLPGTVKLADGTTVPTGMAPQITPAGAAPNPEPAIPAVAD